MNMYINTEIMTEQEEEVMQVTVDAALNFLSGVRERIIVTRGLIILSKQNRRFLDKYTPEEIMAMNLWERKFPLLIVEILELQKLKKLFLCPGLK
jgi:hypothetical protein